MTRRRFFASAGAAAAAVTTGLHDARAESSLTRLDESDPTAKALNYAHDAKTVDAAKRPSSQFCSNCALFAGEADDEWAGCSIFPGKAVSSQGWCSVWAPKQTG
jgi:hypothetical protein